MREMRLMEIALALIEFDIITAHHLIMIDQLTTSALLERLQMLLQRFHNLIEAFEFISLI